MKNLLVFILVAIVITISACAGENKQEASQQNNEAKETVINPLNDRGVGPIKSLSLPDLKDEKLASDGKEIFENYCSACHKLDKRYIGPPLENILDRRTPEWVMNMILNPEVMVRENALARQILEEYHGAPMANQNLTEDQARAILEFLR
jgi:mono/diheme cytochrome c family protein